MRMSYSGHEGLLLAPVVLATILINDAHGLDHCAWEEVLRKIKWKIKLH